MELREAIRTRRSVRRFLDKPVAKAIIREIIDDAVWSPSWGNTQPWECVVASGSVLEEFKKRNKEAIVTGQVPNPEISMPMKWPAAHKKRYQEIGRDLFATLSIARDDKEARFQYYVEMCGLFDAPAFVLVTVDTNLSVEYALHDVGMFVQTFCLLAHDRGLGTCIMAAAVQYPDILRDLLSVPDTQRIVVSIAVGWPDRDAVVNTFARTRKDMDGCVRWVE